MTRRKRNENEVVIAIDIVMLRVVFMEEIKKNLLDKTSTTLGSFTSKDSNPRKLCESVFCKSYFLLSFFATCILISNFNSKNQLANSKNHLLNKTVHSVIHHQSPFQLQHILVLEKVMLLRFICSSYK